MQNSTLKPVPDWVNPAYIFAKASARYYDLDTGIVTGHDSKHRFARARHVAIHLACEMTDLTLERVGVIYGRKRWDVRRINAKINERAEYDTKLASEIAIVRSIALQMRPSLERMQ